MVLHPAIKIWNTDTEAVKEATVGPDTQLAGYPVGQTSGNSPIQNLKTGKQAGYFMSRHKPALKLISGRIYGKLSSRTLKMYT